MKKHQLAIYTTLYEKSVKNDITLKNVYFFIKKQSK